MGTGFFISMPKDKDSFYVFLCTCKHIVKDAVESYIFLNTEKNNKIELGNPIRIDLENFQNKWIYEDEHDIAILTFAPIINYYKEINTDLYFRTIDILNVPSKNDIEEYIDGIEKIYFVGYPDDKYDTVNMIPIIRTGITATPFSINFDGKPKFLIDASIFEGSSGSPVLICDCGSYTRKGNGLCAGNRNYFLGIVSEAFYNFQKQYLDIGLVYKSYVIKELILKILIANNFHFSNYSSPLKSHN